MLRFLILFSRQRLYWVAIILSGLLLEAAALYYQYVLDEWPCVLCIHIRIWIAGFILVGVLALLVHAWTPLLRLMHGLNLAMMIGFAERSWQVLAVERGWVFGDCAMDLGMPPWFALDKWLPSVFEVQTSCGYTPLILLNISMAEILMLVSVLMALVAAMGLVFSFLSDSSVYAESR